MFSVGALDAYFCDAYTDVVAATLASKSRQPAIALPTFFYDIKLTIRAILEEYTKEYLLTNATARQKSMAFLKALGKWEDASC